MPHYRLVASGALPAGDIWVTGLDVVRDSGGSTAGALTAWQTAWELLWNGTGASDDLKSLLKTTVTTTILTATQVNDLNKNVDQAVATVALAGTSTDDSMPGETSPVISLRTANASKSGRGRRFLPCLVVTTELANGTMDSAVQDQIRDGAQNMVQSLNGDSYEVQVWHVASQTGDPVIALDVANLYRRQGRRQNKVPVVRSRVSV